MKYITAAAALIKRNNKYLLVKLKGGSQASLWTIPGGAVEESETFSQAAVRETREETGFEISPENIVTVLQENFGQPCVTIVFKAKITGGTLKIQKDEIAEAMWASFEEITKMGKSKVSAVASKPISDYEKNLQGIYVIYDYV